jgi:NTP pyrophosphatase (non-canonical NTP hydrolase)
MKYQELESKVVEWAHEKGIMEKATPYAQGCKTCEESDELLEALVAQKSGLTQFINSKGKMMNTQDEIKDALGDILVTIIIQAEIQKLSLEDCLEVAYNVIAKRTGKMIDGTFVKNE